MLEYTNFARNMRVSERMGCFEVNYDLEAIWRDVLASSEEILPEGVNSIWLETCSPVSLENGSLVIEARNSYTKSKMDEVILKPLTDFLEDRG